MKSWTRDSCCNISIDEEVHGLGLAFGNVSKFIGIGLFGYCKTCNLVVDLFYLGIDKLNPSRIFTVKFLFLLFSLDHHIVVYCFNCDILDCIVIGNYLVN